MEVLAATEGRFPNRRVRRRLSWRRMRGLTRMFETARQVLQLLKLMEFIGAINGGKPVAQVALNYLVAKGALPIPGVKSAAHVADIAGALSWQLGHEEVETLDEKLDYLGFK
jgi:aryl-alcohol dehydrogenase-like predicted oxidoreductase